MLPGQVSLTVDVPVAWSAFLYEPRARSDGAHRATGDCDRLWRRMPRNAPAWPMAGNPSSRTYAGADMTRPASTATRSPRVSSVRHRAYPRHLDLSAFAAPASPRDERLRQRAVKWRGFTREDGAAHDEAPRTPVPTCRQLRATIGESHKAEQQTHRAALALPSPTSANYPLSHG